MTKESKNPAQLAAQIFGRTLSAWNAVHTFRWMGQLGLPHAANQAAWQHERTTHQFARAAEYVDTFIGDGGRERLVEIGFFETAAQAMTETAVSIFNFVSDASSLIFAHSVLDSAALDWCRVCAIAEPNDIMPYIEKKRVTLSEIKDESFVQLRDNAISDFFISLEREISNQKTRHDFCRVPSSQ